jgi:ArsR family transcriptional regulator, arsenate/arsenite/antimonite-responsive transcriptional repressor / arsenate reductase (thioredoxin)
MDTNHAATLFATLGHPGRLSVLRLLMRFAPRPQRPTEIAQALLMKQNTLSHHLADLAQAGLVTVTREGRSLFYTVDLHKTEALISYLSLDLGRGRADMVSAALGTADQPAPAQPFHVLFLCSGNSARSIIAEALLRDMGAGRFIAYSAGTQARGQIAPQTLDVLHQHGHATAGLYSKPLATFQTPEAPQMDFVFTVCDTSAILDCPPWPGRPITGHWGLPDPVRATQAQGAQAFAQTYAALHRRILNLVALPIPKQGRRELQARLDALDEAARKLENV